MNDLTNAELDAAVATAMGKQPQLRPDSRGVVHCMVPYPQDCAPDAQVAFRPSRGGAAAWEVLEWVRRRYEVIFADQDDDPRLVWCDISTDPHNRICHVVGAYGPTDATALCRAVVALGEAG